VRRELEPDLDRIVERRSRAATLPCRSPRAQGLREPWPQALNEYLNEKFGLALGESDKLLFDQFEEDWAADGELVDQARSNTLENFRLVFDPRFMDTIVGRMDSNQAIFKQILDDPDFKQVLADFYLRKVYHRLRVEDRPAVG
jgi:hypothetical protein